MQPIRREEIKPIQSELFPRVIASRWVFFLALYLTFFIFSQVGPDVHILNAFLGLFLLNSVLTALHFVVDLRENTRAEKLTDFVGYLADSLTTAVLVAHTGGFNSPFVLAYAYLIMMISENGRVVEVLFYGLVFLATYFASLYLTYGTLHAISFSRFGMVTCLFAVFALRAIIIGRKLRLQTTALTRSKEALESFAAGLKASNETLIELSNRDPVTGCYNFPYFRRLLNEEIERAKRYQTSLAVLIVDIDNFQAYNELFGHQRGDQVLLQLVDIIRQNLRDYDLCARFIGDDFILALMDTDVDVAKIVAARLSRAVAEHSFYGESELPSKSLTVSIGIAVYPDNAETCQDLINYAEDALRKAKLTRGNQIRVYSSIVEELRENLSDSESMIDTLQTLLMVVNARDRYTYGHSERVAKYAVAIGKEMGLAEEELQRLKYAAFLHDVGKIEIGREVLNKRENLTAQEWDLLQQHPMFGLSIIEPIRGLEGLLPIIRSHHERFDGLGYPDGLGGSEIPLLARILAVADSFDAMRSNRPYRAALSKEVAVTELIKGKGTQFDPEVVDTFLKIVDRVEDDQADAAE